MIFSAAIFIVIAYAASEGVLRQWERVHNTYAAYQQNAEDERQNSAHKVAEACHGLHFIAFRKCVSNEMEAYYQDQATNHDLVAQQNMAFWAKWLFIFTVISIFTTVIVGYFVWQTFVAQKTANSDQRRVVQAQLEFMKFDFRFALQEHTQNIISIDVDNVGATSAVDISVVAELEVLNGDVWEHFTARTPTGDGKAAFVHAGKKKPFVLAVDAFEWPEGFLDRPTGESFRFKARVFLDAKDVFTGQIHMQCIRVGQARIDIDEDWYQIAGLSNRDY